MDYLRGVFIYVVSYVFVCFKGTFFITLRNLVN